MAPDYLCGGTTPFYHQALCTERQWLAYLHDAQIPYGGTSAGAAITARAAIVGGWQVEDANHRRAILNA